MHPDRAQFPGAGFSSSRSIVVSSGEWPILHHAGGDGKVIRSPASVGPAHRTRCE